MIENGVRELWYFVHSEVKKLGHIETGELQKHINMLLQDLGQRQRCLSNTKYMHTTHHGLVLPSIHIVCTGLQVHHDRFVPSEPGRWSWRLERKGGQRPFRSSPKQDNIPTGKSHTHTISISW